VTHDQVEALSMGDRIAVMRAGKLVQVGDPLTIYDAPVDTFVGGFIGNPPMNFLTARVERRNGSAVAVLPGGGEVPLEGGVPAADRDGQDLLLGIRAENIEVSTDPGGSGLRGRVLVVEPLGSHNLVTLRIGDDQLKATTRPDERLEADQDVSLAVDAARIRWLDPAGGIALGGREEAGPGAGMGAPQPGEIEAGEPPSAA
jgi:multiple sugar transport system ATP-binding protein